MVVGRRIVTDVINRMIRNLERQRDSIDRALEALRELVGGGREQPKSPAPQKRRLSPEGRARIVEAARRRWAVKKAVEAAKAKRDKQGKQDGPQPSFRKQGSVRRRRPRGSQS
jgi:hypothetical protein